MSLADYYLPVLLTSSKPTVWALLYSMTIDMRISRQMLIASWKVRTMPIAIKVR